MIAFPQKYETLSKIFMNFGIVRYGKNIQLQVYNLYLQKHFSQFKRKGKETSLCSY